MLTTRVELDRIATGGSAIANAPDGRIVFVSGGLPGEVVDVEITAQRPRHLEGRVVEVVESVAGRRTPRCCHVADGCGGCDWQFADQPTQTAMRLAIVEDCLRRLGGLSSVNIHSATPLADSGYRTTMRAAVVNGKAALRRSESHEVVPIPNCLVAHDLVEELLVDGRFGHANEVTIRVGANTGERLVLVSPSLDVAGKIQVPDDVIVVGADEARLGAEAFYHEQVGGVVYRISALSFFQCRPDGAGAMIDTVIDMVGEGTGPIVDAYSGVGLFTAALAKSRDAIGGRPVMAVESNRWAVADAKVNLANMANCSVLRSTVERWRPEPCEVVVADPARSGLGRQGVDRLARTGAEIVVLVSCDPASLARDAGLLGKAGYGLDQVQVLDMFAQTSHVETISRFVKR